MTERRYFAYAEKKAGTNNKFYQVEAIEQEDGRASWEFRWGRIGSNGQSKSGMTYSFGSAKLACDEQFQKKLKRGYREVSALEALASAAEDVTERPNNGLSAVTVVVPKFHAGRSEERCRKFCEKYLTKLNVIRASRWSLSENAYEKQIETLLKQYVAEFKRIKASKTHGPNLVSFADTAYRIFFQGLRSNAGCQVYGYFLV
jgi:predicted DNA-binding WGR domain protein